MNPASHYSGQGGHLGAALGSQKVCGFCIGIHTGGGLCSSVCGLRNLGKSKGARGAALCGAGDREEQAGVSL